MITNTVKGHIIADTHKKLEDLLRFEGEKFQSQRNEVIELLNVHSIIKHPHVRGIHEYWHGQKLEDYIDEFFKLNDQGFAYTYGDRILNFDGKSQYRLTNCNQLLYISDLLNKEPNTRRAVMSLYSPIYDMYEENIPCLNHIQYQIRDNTILTTIMFRSHDIDAYYPNICGLAEITKWLSDELDLRVGRMDVYSNNLHKYLTEM
ncbi:MAG: thymidylate synthase [Methanobacterium paludis]|nr:thymidylate synthase [Methanobacterium paludis]